MLARRAAICATRGAAGRAAAATVVAVRRGCGVCVCAALAALEAFLSSQVATILEHAARVRMERPKGALARLVGRARNLNKAVVE